jgi:hypothetical protein
MRRTRGILLGAVFVALTAIPGRTAEDSPASFEQLVDRIGQQEMREVATLRKYAPFVEIYIQDFRLDRDLGKVPESDEYFLGKANLQNGAQFRSLLDKSGKHHGLFSSLKGFFSDSYVPDGFLRMILIDTSSFDRQHYQFEYVRREFLGEVRCLVFDVVPTKSAGKGRFKGRIWVEDQGFNVVRFNGVFGPNTLSGWYFHFDSWRVNAGPSLWLPAYVYSEESEIKDMFSTIRFKAQVRLWGYNLSPVAKQEELSRVLVDAAVPVHDRSEAAKDPSPIESERSWENEAEQNALERLEQAGLLAARGDVDNVLETVVNNLVVSNNLNALPDIRCRVLLTSTLESFVIGHTIVLSRGLIDVLPDEASLATMLAYELAHIALGHSIDTKYAFNDRMIFPDLETFHHFEFRRNPREDADANTKAVELLKSSPYKDSLGNAGLFLKALSARSKQLPHLISGHLGDRVPLTQELLTAGPSLEPKKADQIAALPLGSRIKLDPWSDRIGLVKSKAVPLLSAREKMPFEVTPLMPYLVRETNSDATAAVRPEAQPPSQK